MTQGSADLGPEVRALLGPLEDAIAAARRVRADNADFLDRTRHRGLRPEERDLMERAAESPGAPESLRRLARRVAAGDLDWADVFSGRAGEDGTAFREAALHTARQHWATAEVARVEPPREALDLDVDPETTSAAIDADLGNALLRGLQR
ncbi:hypothetical protein AB3X52_11680 [Nocardioides sp. DS6]|uniref:DUF222 domain-containing protein n=1 Tax=Nocardioides eburneus TaxID=3231482 RepID=A0ABV3T0F8_9ACTN